MRRQEQCSYTIISLWRSA